MALISFKGSPHGGSQKLLPEWRSQGRITPITIIDHSIVGSAIGAWLLFRDSSGLESHFIVRGRRSRAQDGHIWQLMDTGRRADANRDANAYAISIETEDDGDPDHQPWTGAQLQSLAWLHNKLRSVHPTIPRRRSRSCSDPAGLGYHALALHTEIPTTRGLRPLSDIAVRDEVFDELGKPCRVTNVTDLWPQRCWRLLFSDGAEVLASGEHLWVTWTTNERHHDFRRGGKRYERRGPKPGGFPPNWLPCGLCGLPISSSPRSRDAVDGPTMPSRSPGRCKGHPTISRSIRTCLASGSVMEMARKPRSTRTGGPTASSSQVR